MRSQWSNDPVGLAALCLDRLRSVMRLRDVPALLTADPTRLPLR